METMGQVSMTIFLVVYIVEMAVLIATIIFLFWDNHRDKMELKAEFAVLNANLQEELELIVATRKEIHENEKFWKEFAEEIKQEHKNIEKREELCK